MAGARALISVAPHFARRLRENASCRLARVRERRFHAWCRHGPWTAPAAGRWFAARESGRRPTRHAGRTPAERGGPRESEQTTREADPHARDFTPTAVGPRPPPHLRRPAGARREDEAAGTTRGLPVLSQRWFRETRERPRFLYCTAALVFTARLHCTLPLLHGCTVTELRPRPVPRGFPGHTGGGQVIGHPCARAADPPPRRERVAAGLPGKRGPVARRSGARSGKETAGLDAVGRRTARVPRRFPNQADGVAPARTPASAGGQPAATRPRRRRGGAGEAAAHAAQWPSPLG